ncbi:MAG: galactose mutarotase [Candidatus Delongbacteria bacterium]|nr:galactose mutarotase [Candidatus Delongbacteria bacterium]MBN2834259.1 galactose mutarotase [Candidatus Delongbacteria bacterium]
MKKVAIKSWEGMNVEIVTLGGSLKSIIPSFTNKNMVLSYKKFAEYKTNDIYSGSIIGRFANRIENSSFEIDGIKYCLDSNLGKHHLHGGSKGFSKINWSIYRLVENSLTLYHKSKDSDMGYPGNLDVFIKYTLIGNKLIINFDAVSDKDTFINLSIHPYFNLNGFGNILNHKLKIDSDFVTFLNNEMISEEIPVSVANTIYDFRSFRELNFFLTSDHPQLRICNGLDNNFCSRGDFLSGELSNDDILMKFKTDMPGFQFYTGNYLNYHGFEKFGGIAIEPQFYLNAPNNRYRNSVLLKKGELYSHFTEFEFEKV